MLENAFARVLQFREDPPVRFRRVIAQAAENLGSREAEDTSRLFEGFSMETAQPPHRAYLEPVPIGDPKLMGMLARACVQKRFDPRGMTLRIVVFFAADAPADPWLGIAGLHAARVVRDLDLALNGRGESVSSTGAVIEAQMEALLFILGTLARRGGTKPFRYLVPKGDLIAWVMETRGIPEPIAVIRPGVQMLMSQFEGILTAPGHILIAVRRRFKS